MLLFSLAGGQWKELLDTEKQGEKKLIGGCNQNNRNIYNRRNEWPHASYNL